MHIQTRTLRRLLVLALALLAGAPAARADENDPAGAGPSPQAVSQRTDVVFLLDVSGSMRKRDGLRRAQDLLVDILDKVVHPGTNAALIPFGTGVQQPQRFAIPNTPQGAAQARARIREAIGKVRAKDSYTYLFHGIDRGLELLMEFKEQNPNHTRNIILVSDGKQLIRRGEKWVTLRQVLERFEKLGFKLGEDWFIWYAHFGEPDETLRKELERTGAGRTISLDELPTLTWAYTRLDPAVLDVGRRQPGAWTKMVRLIATTDAQGVGRTVRFDIDRGSLPADVDLQVSPATVELTDTETEIALELRCTGTGTGVFDDAAILVSSEEGALHWVETKRIALLWHVAQPRIDLGLKRVELGRVAPGLEAARSVAMIPNGDAASAAPTVDVSVDGVPDGFAVEVDRARIVAGERRDVKVTVKVPAGAKPGDYESRIRFGSEDHVVIVPSEVTVTYRVGFGRVTVGQDRVVLGPMVPGRTVTASVTLTPDGETAAQAPEVGVELVGAPDGVIADVPARVKVDGRVSVPVKVRVPYGLNGKPEAVLRFRAPAGVRVEPTEVPVVFEVVKPTKLLLPSLVDLGDVPASRAREIDGRLKLAVDRHLAGSQLELVGTEGGAAIDPRVITLQEGTTHVPFQLKTMDVGLGQRTASFHAFFTRDGVRRSAGTVTVRWRVTETFVRVRNWASPPAVPSGNAEGTGTLVVEASSDLVGKRLRLATVFESLAKNMQVELGKEEVVLEGGLQSVPVRFLVRSGRAGTYRGSLRVGFGQSLEGVAEPAPLDVQVEVTGASVYVALQGSLDGVHPASERTLMLVFTAQAVPVPTTLSVTLEREGLPADFAAEVPETVTIDRADGTTRVPLRFVIGQDVSVGRWQPRIVVKAKTPGVAVAPERVPVSAGVPQAITIYREKESKAALWIGLAALVLVLGIGAYLILRPKPKEVLRVDVPPTEQAAVASGDELEDFMIEDEDDDMVIIDVDGLDRDEF